MNEIDRKIRMMIRMTIAKSLETERDVDQYLRSYEKQFGVDVREIKHWNSVYRVCLAKKIEMSIAHLYK